jgi:Protein of unknown function (DUF1559)
MNLRSLLLPRFTIGRMMRVIVGLGFLFAFIALILRVSDRREIPGNRCFNNLHNIVLGVLGYEWANGVLPAGSWPNAELEPERRLSWYAQILPQLDEQDKYDALEKGGPWDSGQNVVVAKQRIRMLLCNRAALAAPGSPESASYVGIAGLGKDAARLPKSDSHAGVFGYDRQTRLADIKDGTANTMMIAETGWLGHGPWAGSDAPAVHRRRPAIRRPARTLCARGDGGWIGAKDSGNRFAPDLRGNLDHGGGREAAEGLGGCGVLLRKMIGVNESSEASKGMVRNGGPYGGASGAIAGAAATGWARLRSPRVLGLWVDHQSDHQSALLPKGRPEIDSSAQVAVGVNRSSRSRSTSISVSAPTT